MHTITYRPPWPAEARGVPQWWDTHVAGHLVRLTYSGGQLHGTATSVSASGIAVDGVPVSWGQIHEVQVYLAVTP